MENSNIEWTDHTFNPWIGCTKVSPGCANCYAETLMDKRYGKVKWGKGQPRQRTSAANWKLPMRWNKGLPHFHCPDCGIQYGQVVSWLDAGCGVCGEELKERRSRVFCASLADWLDDEVPAEWLVNLLQLVWYCKNLDWLLLTKRPENFFRRGQEALKFAMENEISTQHADFFDWLNAWINGGIAPDNAWVGTTVEDQQRANERIPELLNIPAKVRFLSCEPLLGRVQIHTTRESNGWTYYDNPLDGRKATKGGDYFDPNMPRIHWVIAGGESGHGARPMKPDWARSLRDQCDKAGVPFLFKQWGEWVSVSEVEGPGEHFKFDDGATVRKTGKKLAGRHLDGEEHNGFPV